MSSRKVDVHRVYSREDRHHWSCLFAGRVVTKGWRHSSCLLKGRLTSMIVSIYWQKRLSWKADVTHRVHPRQMDRHERDTSVNFAVPPKLCKLLDFPWQSVVMDDTDMIEQPFKIPCIWVITTKENYLWGQKKEHKTMGTKILGSNGRKKVVWTKKQQQHTHTQKNTNTQNKNTCTHKVCGDWRVTMQDSERRGWKFKPRFLQRLLTSSQT